MENLTAFVRERTQRTERERKAEPLEKRIELRAYFHWRQAGQPDGRADEMWAEAVKQEERGEPLTVDILAVLRVIQRRSKRSRKRERSNYWHLDLRGAVLRRARLSGIHLEGADLGQ